MKRYILKDKKKIQEIFNNQKVFSNKLFLFFVKENIVSNYQICIAISKKSGNAVFRNKQKRRVKEILFNDDYLDDFISYKYDYVILLKKEISLANMNKIKKYLKKGLKEIQKYEKNEQA